MNRHTQKLLLVAALLVGAAFAAWMNADAFAPPVVDTVVYRHQDQCYVRDPLLRGRRGAGSRDADLEVRTYPTGLTVRTLDANNRAPVSDVRIDIERNVDAFTQRLTHVQENRTAYVSNEEGEVRMPSPEGGARLVVARKSHYATATHLISASQVDLTILLEHCGVATGCVRTESGEPIAGAHIRATIVGKPSCVLGCPDAEVPSAFREECRSDAQGMFEISLREDAQYQLTAHVGDYILDEKTASAPLGSAGTYARAGDRHLDLVLQLIKLVRVRFLNAATGSYIREAPGAPALFVNRKSTHRAWERILVWSHRGPIQLPAFDAASAVRQYGVPVASSDTARARLLVRIPGFEPVNAEVSLQSLDQVNVGDMVNEVYLEPTRDSAVVRFTRGVADTGNLVLGDPSIVSVLPSGSATRHPAIRVAERVWEASGVPSGRVALWVDDGIGYGKCEDADLAPGEVHYLPDCAPRRAGFCVTLLSESGAEVYGGAVWFSQSGSGMNYRAIPEVTQLRASEDGSRRLRVPQRVSGGEYEVTAKHPIFGEGGAAVRVQEGEFSVVRIVLKSEFREK